MWDVTVKERKMLKALHCIECTSKQYEFVALHYFNLARMTP